MNLFNLFAPKMQAQMKLWNYKKVLLNLHICQKKQKVNVGFVPKITQIHCKLHGLQEQPQSESEFGSNH
jgi:hypothetical protein